jgi:VanZ family protein
MNYKYTSLALLWMSLIIYTSSIPAHSFPGSGSLSEQIISNLGHIPEFALLTFLWLKAFIRKENKGKSHMAGTLILIGLIIFAISDEIHQSFIPGRSASLMDIGLDVLGIFSGLGVLRIFGMFSIFQNKSATKSLRHEGKT